MIALIAVAACRGDDASSPVADGHAHTADESASTGGTGGRAPCPETTQPTLYPATWDGVQAYFAASCRPCHLAGGIGSPPLTLPEGVEADVTSGAGRWVVAGDAESSHLWWSASHTGYGVPMPLGSRCPAPGTGALAGWIDAGAELSTGATSARRHPTRNPTPGSSKGCNNP